MEWIEIYTLCLCRYTLKLALDRLFLMDMKATVTTRPNRKASLALKNKQLIATLVASGLGLFFVAWLSVVTESLLYAWDQPINSYFTQLRQSSPAWITSASHYFARAGSQGITAVTILLLFIWAFRRRFRYFWLLLTTVIGVELLWLALVFLIGRPRPTEITAFGDTALPGFPSGHVMLFIAFFGTLLYLFFLEVKKPGARIFLLLLVGFLLLLTGFIRLYFTFHYFTDIIGGYGIGLAWTAASLTAVDWIRLKRQNSA